MAKYDFYKKKGNLNYRERAMLEDISKRIESNPALSKDIIPATNFEELKQLHSQITSDIAEVISETKNDIIPKSKPDAKKPFIDPLNREQPIINDYVTDDKFNPFADYEKSQKANNNFAEPTNYQDAFDLPDEEEMMAHKSQNVNLKNNPKFNGNEQNDNGGTTVNRRKAKRFATSIVNITCRLLEVGFMWYATKDINENKLAEYEMTGEMDLSLIVELPDGQEATIKEFFLAQMPDIEKASKVNPESKASLIEAMTELFIEKNIQPSASYEVLIEGISLLAEQGIKVAMIVQQNNAMLMQLRQIKLDKQTPQQSYASAQSPVQPDPTFDWDMPTKETSEDNESFSIAPISNPKTNDAIMMDDEELDEEQKNDLTLLNEIETKE